MRAFAKPCLLAPAAAPDELDDLRYRRADVLRPLHQPGRLTSSIAVPWTASDATSGIATNGVTLYANYNGGGYSASGTASGTGGTFNFTPANGDGTYCFYTRATDNAGNVEAAPATNDGCTIYKTKATIGDRVWYDTDGDGVEDPGETGINGVTLTLYQGATVIGTATTAGDGNYLFSNLTGAALRTVRDNFSTQAV